MKYASALLPILLSTAALSAAVDVSPLRNLPVLDKGRVKPFDTLALESVRFITGRESFGTVATTDGTQSLTDLRPPTAMLLDWTANAAAWESRPLLYVPLLELRAQLRMKESEKWTAPEALRANAEFMKWSRSLLDRQALAEKGKDDFKPTQLEMKGMELEQRLEAFDALATGRMIFILPVPIVPGHAETWLSIEEINAEPDLASLRDNWALLLAAYKGTDDAAFAKAVDDVRFAAARLAGKAYPDTERVDREVFYNTLKPFRISWVIYFAALCVLIASNVSRARWMYAIGMTVFIAAVIFHGGGFALRCSITGWAPVTNMYETVIWVALMTSVFALVLELIYRRRVIAIGGAAIAVIATIIADTMPPDYGNSIRNLTPVLRSNYWLTIHVLTIVSSYAAFALALVLGNIVLGQYLFRRRSTPDAKRRESIRTNIMFTYRATQIGVLFVLTGTILGGVWAQDSWGRFWGWDPKEVWALIVFLTYLALLHGRYAGWIGQFGTAAGAVLCFTAVLMSWYGVNFVLGVGLHAYGFGTGGQGYVMMFVLLQWAYVAAAWIAYRKSEPRIDPPEVGAVAAAS